KAEGAEDEGARERCEVDGEVGREKGHGVRALEPTTNRAAQIQRSTCRTAFSSQAYDGTIVRTTTTLLVVAVLTAARVAHATDIAAASCSQMDVESAIAKAASGDTVNVPGPCNATWSQLTLAADKPITLSGGNGGTTTIDGPNTLVVSASDAAT